MTTSDATTQRSAVRRARTVSGRIAMIVIGAIIDVCGVANVPGAAVFSVDAEARVRVTPLGTLLAFLAILAWLTVLWSDRLPLLPVIVGGALAVVGISYLLLLVSATGLVRRRPERLRPVALGVSAVIALFVAREVLTSWGSALPWFLSSDAGAADQPAWILSSIIVAAVSVGIAAAVVTVSRTRARADRSEERAAAELHRADALREETVRQAERERIARDMHDALAHRLSVVSLHAGALEAAAGGDAAGDMARTVREQTHAALQDMRGLIGDLRSAPDAASGSPATMRALGGLIAGIRAAGHPITSMILIEGADRAGALLDGAVFRIVQEALTNAVKHAPGAPVDVFVQVHPAEGARIRVVNPLGHAGAGVPGGRNGILGIRERAAALGGQTWIGVHEGTFIVDARMPWQERG